MKRLIVYYSLEGNTEYIAEKLAENIGTELLKLIPKKSYQQKSTFAKYFWGGKSAVMAEKPELEPYKIADDYDEIIIGFPVWAGNITPPIRTFVSENEQPSYTGYKSHKHLDRYAGEPHQEHPQDGRCHCKDHRP
ncbi:flavodoxin family protein [Butyrivibrio sp. AC2005]|uniref:flavodoxin family protein n=1 Tax=Butyrivibrio sp. AC2005 TaxID=1280672 RepID=UPI00040FA799|nr:hypothetical protein [Butyrivibrio sp. AC2005]